MAFRRHDICVSTSKPSTSLTPGGGGGSFMMLCPRSGSLLSSLRTMGGDSGTSKSALGISSLSPFPSKYSPNTPGLLMAYGGSGRKDDTYGMLLSLRAAPLSPLIHWKCRLPESQMSGGLSVSPCGYYVVGGGASGNIFVWTALGGALIRTVKAHYRSVTVLTWSDCGHYLVTGGADGLVHVFSLMDLVDQETAEGQTVAPIRTHSTHILPITAITALPSCRMASTSVDAQVVVFEIFSDTVVLTLQMPRAMQALDYLGGRLYAGAVHGSVYVIDLDIYAMHQTAQLGVTVKRRAEEITNMDKVFGRDQARELHWTNELHGHDHSISSIAAFKEGTTEVLVSGDEAGSLRVWDIESRVCIRVIQPWSHSVQTTTTGGKTQSNFGVRYPVTSILVVPRGEDSEGQQSQLGMFGGSRTRESKTRSSVVNLVTPLQKFTDNAMDTDEKASIKWTPVPFLQQNQGDASLAYWDVSSGARYVTKEVKGRKAVQVDSSSPAEAAPSQDEAECDIEHLSLEDRLADKSNLEKEKEELLRLRKELEDAKSTIQRWEKVNNKLISKLKQATSSQPFREHQDSLE